MISFSGSNGSFTFNRAVVKGFVFPHDGSLSFVGEDSTGILVAQLGLLALYLFPYTGHFWGTHTNSYSLDHVFNWADSVAVVAGVPFHASVTMYLTRLPGEFSPRIAVDFGLGSAQQFTVDLQRAVSPWYVQP